jgi:endonuclease/exonuclease/phosphatase family metal-dependent hydrolase
MSPQRKLSILTWNVWFDELEQHTRYDAIFSICRDLQPDIICFQEVIPYFVAKMKLFPFFMDKYTISDHNLDGKTIEPYGVMILCKKKLSTVYTFHDFPTIHNRKLLVAEVTLHGKNFAVGTVHLESLANHPTREAQLTISNNILKQYEHSVLCGDFNFCSYSNFRSSKLPLENDSLKRLLPDFIDMWDELRPPSQTQDEQSTRGYTFDTLRNPMIGRTDERMRLDRICHRLNTSLNGGSGGWRPRSIEIIGDSPIIEGRNGVAPSVAVSAASVLSTSSSTQSSGPFDSPPSKTSGSGTQGRAMMVLTRDCRTPVSLFPSDHFGLYAVFDWRDVKEEDK